MVDWLRVSETPQVEIGAYRAASEILFSIYRLLNICIYGGETQ